MTGRIHSSPSSSTSRVLLSLLLLLTLLLTASVTAISNITSISGCTDVGLTTTQCRRPVRLTIGGAGFIPDNSQPGWGFYPLVRIYTSANPANAASTTDCGVDRDTVNDTYLECDLPMAGGFNLLDFDTLLNVTYDNQRGGKSMPYAGVSFQSLPVPHITGIEGCASVAADGLTTSGCVPTATAITLHGSGFSSLNYTDFYIQLGSRGTYANINTDNYRGALPASPDNYTDSRLTFTIADSYNNLVVEEQCNGAPIPLYLANWNSSNGYYIRQYLGH